MGIMDEITSQIDGEQKSEQTEEKCIFFNKEEVYKNEIEPLVKQIYAIADRENVPVSITVQYASTDKGCDYAMTACAEKKKGASLQMMNMINNDKAILDGDLTGAIPNTLFRVIIAKFGMATALIMAKLFDEKDEQKRKDLLEDMMKAHLTLAFATKEL